MIINLSSVFSNHKALFSYHPVTFSSHVAVKFSNPLSCSLNYYHMYNIERFSNQNCKDSCRSIGLVFRVFVNVLEDRSSIPSRVIPKTQKWYLMWPCLTLSIIRYGSCVKWSNPGKGIAPPPMTWCSSQWKWSLRVTFQYCRQLYLLIILAWKLLRHFTFLKYSSLKSDLFYKL